VAITSSTFKRTALLSVIVIFLSYFLLVTLIGYDID
jgi:hypothetical protein